MAANIAAAHDAAASVNIVPGFPVTVCDERAVMLARAVTQRLFGDVAWQTLGAPKMGAEDFSYVLQKVPGAMLNLGAAPESGDCETCCGLHSNRMVLDESVMARGAAMHCAIAETFLQDGFDIANSS
ncbi:MAG TPA: M20/M25/M40 family metallo-hydrolase [Rhizomicrobium sp.]